jgi:hypothetical protein
MINVQLEDMLAEEAANFPLNKFLKIDGSTNTRRIRQLEPDFQQEALNLIFISKAINIHGRKYGYSEVTYSTMSQLVTIICDIHGEFKQTAKVHLNGSGCPKCARNIK